VALPPVGGEGLEQEGQPLLGDMGAVVLDHDHQLAGVDIGMAVDDAARVDRLYPVLQQVEQDLAHQRRIERQGRIDSVVPYQARILPLRRGADQDLDVLDVVRRQRVALHLGFDQQRGAGIADLGQAALQQRCGLFGLRVQRAVAAEGAQCVQHAAERIVDLVGDAGRDASHGGQPLADQHLLFDLLLLMQVGQHAAEGRGQVADLIAGLELRHFRRVRQFDRHLVHGCGQRH